MEITDSILREAAKLDIWLFKQECWAKILERKAYLVVMYCYKTSSLITLDIDELMAFPFFKTRPSPVYDWSNIDGSKGETPLHSAVLR